MNVLGAVPGDVWLASTWVNWNLWFQAYPRGFLASLGAALVPGLVLLFSFGLLLVGVRFVRGWMVGRG